MKAEKAEPTSYKERSSLTTLIISRIFGGQVWFVFFAISVAPLGWFVFTELNQIPFNSSQAHCPGKGPYFFYWIRITPVTVFLSVPAERNEELRGNECIWLWVPVWKYSKNYQCGQRYTKHRRNELNGLFFVVARARVKWNNAILVFCSVEFSVIEANEWLKVQ